MIIRTQCLFTSVCLKDSFIQLEFNRDYLGSVITACGPARSPTYSTTWFLEMNRYKIHDHSALKNEVIDKCFYLSLSVVDGLVVKIEEVQ